MDYALADFCLNFKILMEKKTFKTYIYFMVRFTTFFV